MLYEVLTWSARRALRWCYRDVHVEGALSAHGPLLLAVNHPNDLADICVVLAHLRRRVTFVANATAAEQPLVRLAYERMGVIPVHRVRDARKAKARGEDSAAANAAAMDRVIDALRAGACVVVFPEGGVHRGPHLGALRTGLARMVMAARDAGVRGVQVVPVGLTYEAPNALRTRVLAHVGEAIDMDTWTPAPERPAAPQLTAAIAARLRAVTRNAPDARAHEALSAVADVVAATAPEGVPPLLAANQAWRTLAGEIYGPGVQVEAADDPRFAPAMSLRSALQSHLDVAPARLLAAWRQRETRSAGVRMRDALFGPLGWVLHAPAWWVADRLAAKAPNPADRMARRIVPGLHVMVGWYAVLVAVLGWFVGGASGAGLMLVLALVALLPSLGDAAMRWRDARDHAAMRRRCVERMPGLAEGVASARAAIEGADCVRVPDSSPA
jgi:1-acyl-sn-glycerol-3-phosphate acyltransferase